MKTNVRYFVLGGIAVAVIAIALWMASREREDVAPEAAPGEIAERRIETPPEPSVERRAELPFAFPERDEPEETGAETETASPQSVEGRRYGRVRAGDGAMPARLTVDLYHVSWERLDAPKDDALRLSVVAGADGAFDFPNLPFGHFFVHAHGPNVIGTASIDLSRKNPEWEEEIGLRVSGPIAGVVLDPAGAPVSGALVYIHSWRQSGSANPASAAGGLYFQATTDEDGRFLLDQAQVRPRPIEYRLVAAAEGYAIAFSDFISVGDTNVELRLEPGVSVEGVAVYAETGEPAAGIELITLPSAPLHRNMVTTREDGGFTFENMSAGEYRVDVIDDVYIVDAASETLRITDHATQIRVKLLPGGIVSGFVTDKDTGEGVAGATLVARGQRIVEIYGDAIIATAAADGFYAFKGLASGEYGISVNLVSGYGRGSWQQEARQVSVRAPGEIPNIDFVLSKGIQISGEVVDKTGAPVAGAQVQSYGRIASGRTHHDYATSDQDGSFLLAGLEPGASYQVTAYKRGFGGTISESIEIGSENVFGLRVVLTDPGSIEGTVVDTAGRPIANVRVSANANAGQYGGVSNPTDSAGRFIVGDLAAGSYQFAFSTRSGSAISQSALRVDVAEGQRVTGVRLVFDRAFEWVVEGRVRNMAGQPIAGALVTNRYDGSSYPSTDETGRFELRGVDQAEIVLVVEHRDYSTVTLPGVTPGTTDVDIRMRGRGAIEGRVIDARTRAPLSGVSVRDQPEQGAGYFDSGSPVPSDDDGRFRIENAHEGNHLLYFTAVGYATLVHRVEGVEENETIRGITIALEPEAILEGIVTSPAGQPVAAATVDYEADGRGETAKTASDGRFRMTAMPSGNLIVRAYHDEFASGSVNVHLASGRITEVEIRLTNGGTVQGYVTMDGEPAAGVTVRVQSSNSGMNSRRENIQTNENGFYALANVSEGDVIVQTQMDEWRWFKMRTLQMTDNQTIDASFDFTSGGGTIEGTIFNDDGQPAVASISVWIESGNGDIEQVQTQSGPDGRYRLEHAPAGPLTLRVHVDGPERREHEEAIEVAAGETVTFDSHRVP